MTTPAAKIVLLNEANQGLGFEVARKTSRTEETRISGDYT